MEFESIRMQRIAELDELIHSKSIDYALLKEKIGKLNQFLLAAVRADSMLKKLDALVSDIVSQK